MIQTATQAVRLFNGLEQIRDRQAECSRNCLQGPEADLFSAVLKVRDIVLVDSSLFGKIDLPPAALQPQLPNAHTERLADVSSHPYYGGVRLISASTLSCGSGNTWQRRIANARMMPFSRAAFTCGRVDDEELLDL